MLYKKVRVLCWVMTSPAGLQTKAIHSYKTWGHRCNKILFFSSAENSSFPAPVISKLSGFLFCTYQSTNLLVDKHS